MSIVFEDGGLLTTVQDEGRFGYQQFGVSPAGPMDAYSFQLANILVGNKREEAALEITIVGPRIRFTEDEMIAITGGDLGPMCDGAPIPMDQPVLVKKDSVISFTGPRNGCRAYMSFAGGLEIPEVMGSKSTLMKNQIGGIEGRKLQKGDEISLTAPKTDLPHMERRILKPVTYPKKEIVLRVVLGPQDDCFSKEAIRKFLWNSAQITNETDRMGCRLECEPIPHLTDGNIITDGIAFGSIQVPTNGKPIIMLADRQSTGGYTKIGTVISVDLPKIAQSMPGQRVRFVQVGIDLAQDLYIRRLEEVNGFEKYVNMYA